MAPGRRVGAQLRVRHVAHFGRYEGVAATGRHDEEEPLAAELREGSLTATDLMSRYCRTLYARLGSYEQVARQIALDRRTVKKYIERG